MQGNGVSSSSCSNVMHLQGGYVGVDVGDSEGKLLTATFSCVITASCMGAMTFKDTFVCEGARCEEKPCLLSRGTLPQGGLTLSVVVTAVRTKLKQGW